MHYGPNDKDDKGIRRIRDECVESMKEALMKVESVDTPYWLIALLMSPVFIWHSLTLLLKILAFTVWSALLALLHIFTVPFIAVATYLDLMLISFWFFKRIAGKMSGEEK